MTTVGRYDRPFRFTGPDGTVIFEGASFIWYAQEVLNSDVVTIGRGEAVSLTVTGTILPRWDYGSTDVDFAGVLISGGTVKGPTVLKVLQIAALTDKNLIGVAAENIPAGETGDIIVAGVCCVKCINPPASVVVGAGVTGSATAGSVTALAPLASGAQANQAVGDGTMLGRLAVPPGTAANQTGSLTQLGVLIGPW